jgi:hypothetical protein
MLYLPPRWSRLLLLISLCATSWASDWTAPEHQLASRISAVTGPGAISLEFINRSSLPHVDAESIQNALRVQLSAAGLRFVAADQAAATVQVTLSENLSSYVWIAQIQQGTNQPVIEIITTDKAEPSTPIHEPALMLIRKIQLWSQDEPILDVAVIDSSPPHIIVLAPEKIAMYGLQLGRWQQEQSFPLSHNRPWPRDLRGRLMLRKDHLFDAYLPGMFCSSTAGSPLSLMCRQSDDPWPLSSEPHNLNAFFSPTRNFFTGALAPGIGQEKTVPPFFTAAPVANDNYVLWLFAGADGAVREVDRMSVQTLSRPGWGSDIAAVKTNCGSGTQVLATGNTDVGPDSVQAFEFPDRDPVPVSQPLTFDGSVTALWTEISGGAIVVTHNHSTEKYEAFRLAISCGQ